MSRQLLECRLCEVVDCLASGIVILAQFLFEPLRDLINLETSGSVCRCHCADPILTANPSFVLS